MVSIPADLVDPHPARFDRSRPDAAAVLGCHRRAVRAGEAGYVDPSTGLFVLTALHLWERGTCCANGCRHCPYLARRPPSVPGA